MARTKTTKSIPQYIAAATKAAYVDGSSIAEICRLFPDYTRDQFRWLCDQEKWGIARFEARQQLDAEFREELALTQAQLRSALAKLGRNAAHAIHSGQLKVTSLKDVKAIAELLLLAGENAPKPDPKRFQVPPEKLGPLLELACKMQGIPVPPVESYVIPEDY